MIPTLTKHLRNLVVISSFAVVTLLSTNIHSAEVYKWVDENGNTHYSDKKPSTQDHKRMKVYSGSQRNPSSPTTTSTSQASNTQAANTESAASDEQEKKEIEEQCRLVRENLKIISETSRIKVQENGEYRYLSEEEIAQKKATHEAQLKAHCEP